MEELHGHRWIQVDGLGLLTPVEPLGGIGHVVATTRTGGLSQPPYASLNLGSHVGDVPERVRLNRRRVLAVLGRKLHDPVVPAQVHGTRVHSVGMLHAGTRWEQGERALEGTDALITDADRLPLVILTADCLAVALVDPANHAGAVLHAGWRGLADGIVEAALARLQQTSGTNPGEVRAWCGPGIGPCCYEVGPEVAAHFSGSCRPGEGDRSLLDLRHALGLRLRQAGLLEENITGLPLCTCCHEELFFSHRRSSRAGRTPATGRQGLFFWLDRRGTETG